MYRSEVKSTKRTWPIRLSALVAAVLVIGGGFWVYTQVFGSQTIEEQIESNLTLDDSLTESEHTLVTNHIQEKAIQITTPTTISTTSDLSLDNPAYLLDAYVPITNVYSVKQALSSDELRAQETIYIPSTVEDSVQAALAQALGIETAILQTTTDLQQLPPESVALIPSSMLAYTHKLLSLNGVYFLDSLNAGAIFRELTINTEDTLAFADFNLNRTKTASDILKVNMTGVTALTREMQEKLDIVKDPRYFSAKIGDFLTDADITHVSNEVSFKENCAYSYTLFCSPPEFIETLKASGVDLVELTGNHNNDLGSEYNTATINLYKELGWGTVGGGLNREEARKPYITTQDGTTLAFLAYNYPDSPNGGAIAGADRAGANPFDFSYGSIQEDVASAKSQADFVIVNVQYWECYAYPDGYVEYPTCDVPIGEQEPTFKQLVDLGADMVIGSSAHQPQTYELYEGKPIYYGLGNLYFEQTSWPGTERGLVLTNYFADGALVQTKITPTVYDRDLQPRIMTDEEAAYLLTRLRDAR